MISNKLFDRLRYQLLGHRDYEREMIFGVGLSKTGTSSLDSALSILGYTTIHYPPIAHISGNECSLNWPWWMEKFNSANDLPVASTYRELYELYPNATFILTVREIDAWLESCRKHMTIERENGFNGVPRLDQARRLYFHIYQCTSYEHRAFKAAYQRHVDGVINFFEQKNKALTVMNITGGDGWETLCPAVGRDVPKEMFPKRNVRLAPNDDPIDVV